MSSHASADQHSWNRQIHHSQENMPDLDRRICGDGAGGIPGNFAVLASPFAPETSHAVVSAGVFPLTVWRHLFGT